MYLRALTAAAATALLVLVAGAGASVPPNAIERGLADSVYRGTIAWPGGVTFAEPVALQGHWTLHGQLTNVVVEGATIGGDFSWVLNGESHAQSDTSTGSGRGTVLGTGTVAGTSGSPCFTGTNHVVATITIDGDTFDVEDDYPIECRYTRWQLTAVSCTYATGEWTGATEDIVENAGGVVIGQGTFVLWRTGDFSTPESEDATVNGFLLELDDILRSERIDGTRLGRVLHAVAEYEGNQARNVECGQRQPQFTRMVGNFLYRLLDRIFSEDRMIPLRDLRWLAYAALNTGLIGSGAFQPERAAELDAHFNTQLLLLIAAAEQNRDVITLAQVQVFAGQYGWTDRANEAYEAAERVDPEP